MIRTILVPLDGSRTAEHALPWARSLSRRTGAAVRLARVRRIPPAPVAGEGMTTYDPDPYEYITKEENEYMATAAKTWLDPESETTLTGVLLESTDSIAGTLIRYAESVTADITIMTSRGHGPVSRFLFGSAAIRHSQNFVVDSRQVTITILLLVPPTLLAPHRDTSKRRPPCSDCSNSRPPPLN